MTQHELRHTKIGEIVSCQVNRRHTPRYAFVTSIVGVGVSKIWRVQFFDNQEESSMGFNVVEYWNKVS